jgi:protoglobin
MLDLEPQMTPDWNAIRLDLLQVDEPMRAALREMRPFFARSLPGILARYHDKVRHYNPSSGIFENGAMQEAIRMQLQHWELIAACNFGPDYLASATRFCELNQRAGASTPSRILHHRSSTLPKPLNSYAVIPHLGALLSTSKTKQSNGATVREELFWLEMGK